MKKKTSESKGFANWLCHYIKKRSHMVAPEVNNSIVKYLSNEATTEDLDRLSGWILEDGNDRVFEKYVKIHYGTMTAMNKPDVDKIKRNLLRAIERDSKRTRYERYLRGAGSVLKYAAIGLLFFALGDLHRYGYFEGYEENILIPREDAITIQLDNGVIETIDPSGNGQVKDANGIVVGTQQEDQLIYTGGTNSDQLVYNTIKIPYGKRFDVILSDGTRVFLNSGSSLKYPIKFLKDSDRIVYLIGEAYFEVAHDKVHPFFVNAGDIDVKVLGTKFNVSHYTEDFSTNTVLVEGSVELYEEDEQGNRDPLLILEPGFMAEWSKVDKEMSIENVNTRIHTAWVQGKLIFRNTTFRRIRQALERKYNVTIINQNLDLDDQLFDATFDIENIEQVLESFNKSYAIDYKIIDNKVIIN